SENVDGPIAPLAREPEVAPGAQVGGTALVLGAEDAVELSYAEAGQRIIAMHKHGEIGGETTRAQAGIGHLDDRRLVQLCPLEGHVLHRRSQLASDESEVCHTGVNACHG